MMRRTFHSQRASLCFKILRLVAFGLAGAPVLFIRNFIDTFAFIQNCWKEKHETGRDFLSNVRHTRRFLKRNQIVRLIKLAEEPTEPTHIQEDDRDER